MSAHGSGDHLVPIMISVPLEPLQDWHDQWSAAPLGGGHRDAALWRAIHSALPAKWVHLDPNVERLTELNTAYFIEYPAMGPMVRVFRSGVETRSTAERWARGEI